ncbi:MAG TPA: Na+/H+ antiporter NhaC family protein, partial [Hyphomonas sp.]|nr:Na+/H+ antiporter NhaC family protein [Hyphomonas sp.]
GDDKPEGAVLEILTLLPPVLAILIAAVTRNVYVALGLGLVASETLILGGNPLMGALMSAERSVEVMTDAGNARVLVFCLLIGALIVFMRESGGVDATVGLLDRRGLTSTPRRAGLAPAIAGTLIFVETNVSLLSSGVLGRRLYDTHGISRERLAYVIDSTSAPVSALILLNGWGAYVLTLIQPYGFERPVGVLAGTVAWNAYSILTLLGVYFTVLTNRSFGPMRTADAAAKPGAMELEAAVDHTPPGRAVHMWLPLLVMVAGSVGFMIWTGKGNILAGSGSKSILWGVCLAIAVAAVMLRATRVFSAAEIQERFFRGLGEMVPPVTILLLAIAFGASLKTLGTGAFMAGVVSDFIPPALVPAAVFVVSGLTAFMTGTSWGTYGIMVPIAMPVAQALGLPPEVMLAGVIGGGVFGDHCSPISDTTVIASLAAGCDHVRHVATQLPYALAAGAGALLVYLVAGLALT